MLPSVVRRARQLNITRYAMLPCARGEGRFADYSHSLPPRVPSGLQPLGVVPSCLVERDLHDGAVILGVHGATAMRRLVDTLPAGTVQALYTVN